MKYIWDAIKKHFPIFSHNTNLIYLDNASTTHKPISVINAMNDYQSLSYANIHRWVYHLAEQSEALYMASKKRLQNFYDEIFVRLYIHIMLLMLLIC